MSAKKDQKQKQATPQLDTERIKLLIGFAIFVIGVVLLIFTIVATVIAPFAIPVTVLLGIVGLVSSIGGGVMGWKNLMQFLEQGQTNQHLDKGN